MATGGARQTDLFDPAERRAEPANGAGAGTESLPSLAIPCGFRERRNAPCRRLGNRIVMIDGEPFHHRGHRIVHCDPACFRGEDTETSSSEPAADGRMGGKTGPDG